MTVVVACALIELMVRRFTDHDPQRPAVTFTEQIEALGGLPELGRPVDGLARREAEPLDTWLSGHREAVETTRRRPTRVHP
ncbi:hypothetical protein ABT288_23025 [Streptomyces sp. NPDC001093]|uniref:hypothetical protein n=1 Tax=Streptomyces sp. NPDC001093 TaxID=3154376 RepID=UPI00333068F0